MPEVPDDGICHALKRDSALHTHECGRDAGHKGKHLCGHGDWYTWPR